MIIILRKRLNSSFWHIDVLPFQLRVNLRVIVMKGTLHCPNSKTRALPSDEFFHTQNTKWFQVLLSNTNNVIQHYSLVCTQLNAFKHNKWLNSSIWPKDGILTGTTTQGQSEPGSNGNEEILHIPQSSRSRASPSDGLVSYTGHSSEMQLAYSTAPANWATFSLSRGVVKYIR